MEPKDIRILLVDDEVGFRRPMEFWLKDKGYQVTGVSTGADALVQIERERLALERERLAAERERWKNDSELKSRAEGRGIGISTLVFVGVICVLVGVIAGFLSIGPRGSRASAMGLAALTSKTSTNASGSGKSILLRPVETGGGSKAYLLILD